jgi:uncharacterized protein with HEPN domain
MVDRDLTRLYHMLDCAKTILKFAEKKTRQDLDSDRFFASAIIREFEVLGEAASAISIETRSGFPHIPLISKFFTLALCGCFACWRYSGEKVTLHFFSKFCK